MEIKIEKGIPLPSGGANGIPWTGILKTMDVGDSFAVPEELTPLARRMVGLVKGKKFVTRKIGSELRIWRAT